MENPIKTLLPKGPEGPGIDKEIGETAKSYEQGRQALSGGASAMPAKPAPVSTRSPKDLVNPTGRYGAPGTGEKRIDVREMTKPLGQMHDGGTVPKTGPYVMKAGEHVLTPEKHQQLKSAMGLAASALSHEPDEPKEPPKEVEEMHMRKGANGGFIVKHIHSHPMHKPEEHVHADMDGVHDHLEQHWGSPNAGEKESEESPGVQAAEEAVGLK